MQSIQRFSREITLINERLYSKILRKNSKKKNHSKIILNTLKKKSLFNADRIFKRFYIIFIILVMKKRKTNIRKLKMK